MLQIKHKTGTCTGTDQYKGCGFEDVPIVNKKRKLCFWCNRNGLKVGYDIKKFINIKQKSSLHKQKKAINQYSKKQSAAIKRADLIAYYVKCYTESDKKCENCEMNLPNYSASFVSHILSRGSHPEHALKKINHNILCCGLYTNHCHELWENGSEQERQAMNIYNHNMKVIDILNSEQK